MQEFMEFMEEFKELYHKGEQIAQQMQGGNFGQRRYSRYGMRDNQGSYQGGQMNGSYGQRWGGHQMQGQYPMQGMQGMQGGYPNQQWPDVNPLMFM